jgi:hypothetical protein
LLTIIIEELMIGLGDTIRNGHLHELAIDQLSNLHPLEAPSEDLGISGNECRDPFPAEG